MMAEKRKKEDTCDNAGYFIVRMRRGKLQDKE